MRLLTTLAAGLLLVQAATAAEKIRIVSATLDMADFARQVGGDRVEVHAITRGEYDLHAYEPRPSEVMKLRKADMVIVGGMELDAFMPGLIDAARNPNIRFGAPGFVDPSRGIHALDVPTEKITGDMGDVHPFGNPHFWFSPVNVKTAVSNITAGLVRVAPEYAAEFQERRASYEKQVDDAFEQFRKTLRPCRGAKILQYHPSWDYFCEEMGLEIAGSVEPKPGIPPSARHLSELVRQIEQEDIALVLVEPYYPDKPLRFLRDRTSIESLRLPLLLGGERAYTNYLENMEHIVEQIRKTLEAASRDAGS